MAVFFATRAFLDDVTHERFLFRAGHASEPAGGVARECECRSDCAVSQAKSTKSKNRELLMRTDDHTGFTAPHAVRAFSEGVDLWQKESHPAQTAVESAHGE
jgi:hypothetical protein